MAKTLKSHFNIQQDNDEQVEEEHIQLEVAPDAAALSGVSEEERSKENDKVLLKSEVSIRLSLLGKIASGDGYTYLKAACTGMDLTDIRALVSFKHLQFIDVSNNKLTLNNLQVLTKLPYLLLLHADHNLVDSAALNKTKYLQVIIMNNNNITSCHDVYQPQLSTLELGYNKINKVRFDRNMPELKCLDFRYNIIRDLIDWDFPNLVCLYLAGNKIKSLEGIETLVNLRILHLRNNPIKKLAGFSAAMKVLYYVNLRNCKVSTLKQIKKLKVLQALEVLVLKGTPYMGGTGKEDDPGEEDEEVRIEMIASLPRLTRINKTPVSEDERAEAKEMMMQWIEEGDKDEEEEEEDAEDVEEGLVEGEHVEDY